MKINIDLKLGDWGADARKAIGLAICFSVFLPFVTGIVIAIASPGTLATHGVLGYLSVPMTIWLYGIIFEPLRAVPIAILFAAGFVPLYSRLGDRFPWQWVFALGAGSGLLAGLIRGAFGGDVCYPISGDVFSPASLSPLWYCSISSTLLGALCAPLIFMFGTARVRPAEATGTWKEPSAAPHHDI
ncbi:MAG TPA: hypothetical protein VN929_02215 [Burkholderiales bacterium]|nr:hypothetical protein [Burkholderiales bacterium]